MPNATFPKLELNFQFVRDNFNKADFSSFIFQPIIPDIAGDPNQFSLQIYAIATDGSVLSKTDLSVTPDPVLAGGDRVELGNIPFTKSLLDSFIAADKKSPISVLFLTPFLFGNYAAYDVSNDGNSQGKLGFGGDLKPSPPTED